MSNKTIKVKEKAEAELKALPAAAGAEQSVFLPLTPKQLEASSLHAEIKHNIETIGNALIAMCSNLKRMRDENLYAELGYDSFGSYTYNALKIKERQAYNYIQVYENLPEEFLQLNANVGVTKLQLLAALPALDRNEIVKGQNLEEMSVEDLKTAIDKWQETHKQQLFLFAPEEVQALKKGAGNEKTEEETAAEKAQLEKEKADFQSKLVEFESGKAKIIADAKKAAEKAAKLEVEKKKKSEIDKAVAEARKKAEAEAKKTEDDLKLQLVTEKEKSKNNAIIEKQYEEEKARREKLEKEIKNSANPELTRFKYKFDEIQADAKTLMELYSKLDGETQEKLKEALKKFSGVFIK